MSIYSNLYYKLISPKKKQLEEQELYVKQYRKDAMNQSTKLIQKFKQTFAIATLEER